MAVEETAKGKTPVHLAPLFKCVLPVLPYQKFSGII